MTEDSDPNPMITIKPIKDNIPTLPGIINTSTIDPNSQTSQLTTLRENIEKKKQEVTEIDEIIKNLQKPTQHPTLDKPVINSKAETNYQNLTADEILGEISDDSTPSSTPSPTPDSHTPIVAASSARELNLSNYTEVLNIIPISRPSDPPRVSH